MAPALSALVVIANLTDLKMKKNPEPIDVAGELSRIPAALGFLPATSLTGSGQVSACRLVDGLCTDYPILYRVCHEALINDEPWLGPRASASPETPHNRVGPICSPAPAHVCAARPAS